MQVAINKEVWVKEDIILVLLCLLLGATAWDYREQVEAAQNVTLSAQDGKLAKNREVARLQKELRRRPVVFKKRIVREGE